KSSSVGGNRGDGGNGGNGNKPRSRDREPSQREEDSRNNKGPFKKLEERRQRRGSKVLSVHSEDTYAGDRSHSSSGGGGGGGNNGRGRGGGSIGGDDGFGGSGGGKAPSSDWTGGRAVLVVGKVSPSAEWRASDKRGRDAAGRRPSAKWQSRPPAPPQRAGRPDQRRSRSVSRDRNRSHSRTGAYAQRPGGGRSRSDCSPSRGESCRCGADERSLSRRGQVSRSRRHGHGSGSTYGQCCDHAWERQRSADREERGRNGRSAGMTASSTEANWIFSRHWQGRCEERDDAGVGSGGSGQHKSGRGDGADGGGGSGGSVW
ncbi:unnamed protein product, partial [Phaeothamnion confervicola]